MEEKWVKLCPYCKAELPENLKVTKAKPITHIQIQVGDTKHDPLPIDLGIRVGTVTCPSCGKKLSAFA